MGLIQGPQADDHLLDKFDAKHLTKLLDQSEAENLREHQRQMRSMALTTGLLAATPVAILALCWLFLYHGKSDQVEKIVSALIGLAGGFGIGRATKGRGHRRDD